MNEGADLQNTAFIFAQPGKELILLSWPEMVIGNSISRKVLIVIFVGDVSACHASGTFGPDKVTSSASWVVSNTARAIASVAVPAIGESLKRTAVQSLLNLKGSK